MILNIGEMPEDIKPIALAYLELVRMDIDRRRRLNPDWFQYPDSISVRLLTGPVEDRDPRVFPEDTLLAWDDDRSRWCTGVSEYVL